MERDVYLYKSCQVILMSGFWALSLLEPQSLFLYHEVLSWPVISNKKSQVKKCYIKQRLKPKDTLYGKANNILHNILFIKRAFPCQNITCTEYKLLFLWVMVIIGKYVISISEYPRSLFFLIAMISQLLFMGIARTCGMSKILGGRGGHVPLFSLNMLVWPYLKCIFFCFNFNSSQHPET